MQRQSSGGVQGAVPRGLVFAGFALYAVAFYRDALFGAQIAVIRDLFPILLPFDHVARLLSRWDWAPLWQPFQVLGRPFAADPLSGVFYPPNWLFRQVPEPLGFNASLAAHHLVAAFGMYVFLDRLGLCRAAAVLGGLIFAFGGLLVGLDTMVNGLQSACWLPWMLVTFDVWWERRGLVPLVALALLIGTSVQGAMIEFTLLSQFLIVAVAVDRGLRDRHFELGRVASGLLIANLLAFVLFAVQFVPMLELFSQSSREGGLRTERVLEHSLHPSSLLNFVLARDFGEARNEFAFGRGLWEAGPRDLPWAFNLYVGAAVAATLFSATRLQRNRRRWWAAVTIAFTVAAMGRNVAGLTEIVDAAGPLRVFRYPQKLVFVLHFLLAAGAARGLDVMLASPQLLRAAGAVAGSIAVLSAGVWTAARSFGLPSAALETGLVGATVVFSAWGVLCAGGARFPRLTGWLLVFLSATDLWWTNADLVPLVPWSDVRQTPFTVARMERGAHLLRIYSDDVDPRPPASWRDEFVSRKDRLFSSSGVFAGVANLNAPATVNLADHERLMEVFRKAPPDRKAEMLGRLSVAYVTSRRKLDWPGLSPVRGNPGPTSSFVYRVDSVLPQAYVPRIVVPVKSSAEAVRHLVNGGPSSVAVVRAEIPADVPGEIRGAARIDSYQPERVAMSVRMQTPGLVVLNDTFYRGWQASVDEKVVPIVRVNHFVRGVFLPEGEHRVHFDYRPRSSSVGRFATAAGGTIVLLSIAASSIGRGRRDAAQHFTRTSSPSTLTS